MRPTTVITFERLFLLSLALGIVQMAIGWKHAMTLASPTFVAVVTAITVLIILVLVLMVSRAGMSWPRWVLIVLFAIGLPGLLKSFYTGNLIGYPLVSVLQTVLQFIALCMLFTPAARDWLSRKSPG